MRFAPAPGNDLELGEVSGGRGSLKLPRTMRDKHLYVCGATGTGKSKFLEHLIRQDIMAWRYSRCGMLVLDPHGSLYDSLMRWLATYEIDRPVVAIDLRQDETIVSYNLLRERAASPAVIVENLVEAMAYVWGQSGTDQTPLFARWAGNILRTLYEKRLTLAETVYLVTDAHVRRSLTSGLTDSMVQRDWNLANALALKDFEAQVSSTVNRLLRFLRNKTMRAVFGQSHSSLDLGAAIEEGHIVLVSVAREGAKISKENADLFATLLLTDLWTAAQERGKKQGAKPFYVYLDEFQRFVTPTIAENLDEARGFGLHLTLAHQFPNQLLDAGPNGRRVYNSVMENASSKVVFRLSDEENLKPLASWLFRGVMDPDEIKHKLYSTKVMSHRDEYRTSYSRSTTNSRGGGSHFVSTSGSGEGGSDGSDNTSWREYTAESSGESDAWSEAETHGETRTPTLLPVMGKELSQVQFRSLDEQLFRAMAALFDQDQRQGVARLVGMKAPVPIVTPTVKDGWAMAERVERYRAQAASRWPFVLPMDEAVKRIGERERQVALNVLGPALGSVEPVTAKRRLR